MKICFIGDAAAIHMQRWVTWFAADHEVIVISTEQDAGLAEYRVVTLPSESPGPTRLLESVLAVRRVIALHRPDILHCHYINEAGWFGAASGFRPLVVTVWGSDLYRAPNEFRLARHLNPLTLRRADWVTCDSNDQASLIRSWGVDPERLSVIGWGVDRREFHPGLDGKPARRELGIPLDAPVVLSPRQWYPNSNIPTVVAAHALLPAQSYLILKRLPGFEPDNGLAVQQAIERSPARERIRVVAELAPDELAPLYAAADVTVSLCTTDGTPASVLEAMALGQPIVARENASLAEWVQPPGGRLVAGGDPRLVADALAEFLSDRSLRDRARSHNVELIARRADREAEFERMAEIYERIHGRAGDRRGSNVG